MRIRVKPFTLFLFIAIISFLVFAPAIIKAGLRAIDPLEPLELKKEEWTGILSLWEVSTWSIGHGSRVNWLNKRIREFEQKHPGVFIELRPIDTKSVQLFLEGQKGNSQVLPDMLSFGPGIINNPNMLLTNLDNQFPLKEFKADVMNSSKYNGHYLAIPWMMGSYGIFINNDACQTKEIEIPESKQWKKDEFIKAIDALTYTKNISRKRNEQIFGFESYNGPYQFPLLSLMNNWGVNGSKFDDISILWTLNEKYKNLNPGYPIFSAQTVWQDFSTKKANMILGNQKDLFAMRALEDKGKGFDWSVTLLRQESEKARKVYCDQVQYIGIVKQKVKAKEKISQEFIEYLTANDNQEKLSDLGVFSVLSNINHLYEGDDNMSVLEKSIDKDLYVPNPFLWGDKKGIVQQAIETVTKGDKSKAAELNKILHESSNE